MLDLEDARPRRVAADGTIETVVTALPDLYGRLVGKRITGIVLPRRGRRSHGMHVCDYLLACDMEMDPTPGYAFTSWETGYGDLHAVPDLDAARRRLARRARAIVLCDAVDRGDAPVEVAPRTILRRQLERAAERGPRAADGERARVLPLRATTTRGAARRATGTCDHEPGLRRGLPRAVEHVRRARDRRDPRQVDASGDSGRVQQGRVGARPARDQPPLRARRSRWRTATCSTSSPPRRSPRPRATSHHLHGEVDEDQLAGSSLHVHVSLWDEAGRPLFGRPGRRGLAGTPVVARPVPPLPRRPARTRAGARLVLRPEPSTPTSATVPGTFAPTAIAWSYDNRTAGLPRGRPGAVAAGRVPHSRRRCEPLPRLRGLLAAGLDGLERELDPGPAFEGRRSTGRKTCPQVPGHALREAIAGARGRAAFARQAFGDEVDRTSAALRTQRTEQALLRASSGETIGAAPATSSGSDREGPGGRRVG